MTKQLSTLSWSTSRNFTHCRIPVLHASHNQKIFYISNF